MPAPRRSLRLALKSLELPKRVSRPPVRFTPDGYGPKGAYIEQPRKVLTDTK